MVVAVVATVHLAGLHTAKRFQVLITSTQLVLIAAFIVAGLRFTPAVPVRLALDGAAWREIVSPSFAISLVYVSYAFTGWNAAGYIAGEIHAPQRTIPRALVAGTVLVTVLYVLLNWSFLRTVPLADLAGRVEVGALSAQAMFGRTGGVVMSATIATVLIATISARVPRALQEVITLGRTLKKRSADILAYFDRPHTSNGPTEAINGRLEHLRGSALGFQNLTHYIARSLLETGGFRPRLHPRL